MNFYFAPLEGITGYIYRNAFEELFGGVDKYYAPFISPSDNDRLRGKEIKDLLPENNNKNVNLIPQILTNNSKYFIKAAEQLMEMGYVEELNLNLGCPSRTVISKKKGSGFLTETDSMKVFFEEIFNWRDNEDIKTNISVKTRIGMYDACEFEDIMQIYNTYPISEVIVHPRTRVQMYTGIPDIKAFGYATEVSKNKLCYNGDINAVNDFNKISTKYNVDSVMIGRGLIGNPNLVNEIRGSKRVTREQLNIYHDRIYSDYERVMQADKHLLFKMKELWTYLSRSFEEQHKCAKRIRKAQNLYKYKEAVKEIFGKLEIKSE